MTGDMGYLDRLFRWKDDPSWYTYDGTPLYGVSLTDAAPADAAESFRLWQKETEDVARGMGLAINESTPVVSWEP